MISRESFLRDVLRIWCFNTEAVLLEKNGPIFFLNAVQLDVQLEMWLFEIRFAKLIKPRFSLLFSPAL